MECFVNIILKRRTLCCRETKNHSVEAMAEKWISDFFNTKPEKRPTGIPGLWTQQLDAGLCGSCGSWLVSLEVFSPAQILLIMQTTAIRHSFFLSSLFSFFFTLEFKNCFFLSSFGSFLCSFLFYLVFFPNLLSFHFSFPITLFCLLLPYVLLLFNLFSFYYLSSFRVLYLIPIFHLLCSCFCFL